MSGGKFHFPHFKINTFRPGPWDDTVVQSAAARDFLDCPTALLRTTDGRIPL